MHTSGSHRVYIHGIHKIKSFVSKGVTCKFLFLQGKAPKEMYAILTEKLACFLPGRAKDLSAPL